MFSCGISRLLTIHRCMYPKCPAKINGDVFKRLAEARDFTRFVYLLGYSFPILIILRFQYFVTKNFVESDKHLAFCPNPSCGNAVKFHGVGRPTDVVDCTCGAKFWYVCFSIANEH